MSKDTPQLENRFGRVEPKPEWIEEIVEAADRADQPLFMKDNLRPYLPAGMALRQEWPRGWEVSWAR